MGSGALVGAGIAFFALAFDTYVPRWTGLVRFGQYLPLLAGLGMTFAFAGYLRLWSWLAEVRIPRALPLVAALVGVIWLVPVATTRYAAELRHPARWPGRARGAAHDGVDAATSSSVQRPDDRHDRVVHAVSRSRSRDASR